MKLIQLARVIILMHGRVLSVILYEQEAKSLDQNL